MTSDDRDVLSIPDPSVVVMVGPAGSGKSTLARRLFEPDEILSSDAFRAAIAGDERDQRATGAAFRAIARALDQRLAAGRLTVIDATNVQPSDRRPWLAAARRHGVAAVAIVLDLPPAMVIARDAARQRVVGVDVIRRHVARLRATLGSDALAREGFHPVVVLRSAEEVAAMTVVRASARA